MGIARARVWIALTSFAGALTACSLVTSFDNFTGGTSNANSDASFVGHDASGLDTSTNDSFSPPIESGAPTCPSTTTAVSTGLVGYYPMEEASETTLYDCSGGGYNGTIGGANVTHAAGHTGNALTFGTGNGCVVFPAPTPSTLAFNGATAFSVAMWVRIDAVSQAWPRGYLTGISTDPSTAGWRLALENASETLTFTFTKPDAGGDYEPSAGAIVLGAWHHFAVVFVPGASATTYLDAVAKGTASAAQFPPDSVSLRMGCSGDDQNYLVGALDEVRFYSRAITTDEIAALAQ